jgi:hypothetical protein
MAARAARCDAVLVHADVVITIVFAGFVALAALATAVALLRIRRSQNAAADADAKPGAPVH